MVSMDLQRENHAWPTLHPATMRSPSKRQWVSQVAVTFDLRLFYLNTEELHLSWQEIDFPHILHTQLISSCSIAVSLGVSVYVGSAIFCATCLPNKGWRKNCLMAATVMQLSLIQEIPTSWLYPTDSQFTCFAPDKKEGRRKLSKCK